VLRGAFSFRASIGGLITVRSVCFRNVSSWQILLQSPKIFGDTFFERDKAELC
jgi:hypothetical protein